MAPRFDKPLELVNPPTQWVVPSDFDLPRARQTALDRASLGPTRPADAGICVKVRAASPMWLPFWRTEMQVEGWRVDLSDSETTLRPDGAYRPTRTIRYENIDVRDVLSVCARRGFREGIFGSRVRIQAASVLPRQGDADAMLEGAPRVEADVDWPEAEAWARDFVRRGATGIDTVISKTKTATTAMQFVWVPMVWVDYDYAGEANPKGEGPFFVAFAEHDRTILHERHPSKLRAVMSRLRGLLSFDKSALDGIVRPPRKPPP